MQQNSCLKNATERSTRSRRSTTQFTGKICNFTTKSEIRSSQQSETSRRRWSNQQNVIAQKNATISRVGAEEMQAKKRAEELDKLFKTETQKYHKEVDKVKKLENDKFKTQHEMENLEGQLGKESDRVAESEKINTDLKRQKDSLAQQNGSLLESLRALEALATPL